MVEFMLIYDFFPYKETLYYIWGNCITNMYYSQRGDYERQEEVTMDVFQVVSLHFSWQNKERTWNFSMDIAHIGWTTYICVFGFIAFLCVLFPHLFYFSAILFFNICTCFLLLTPLKIYFVLTSKILHTRDKQLPFYHIYMTGITIHI